MRPRHKAAEYGVAGRPALVPHPASMRPRHKAAEYGLASYLYWPVWFKLQ